MVDRLIKSVPLVEFDRFGLRHVNNRFLTLENQINRLIKQSRIAEEDSTLPESDQDMFWIGEEEISTPDAVIVTTPTLSGEDDIDAMAETDQTTPGDDWGPSNVLFDAGTSHFDGEDPYFEWSQIGATDVKYDYYEIRKDTNWGVKDKNQVDTIKNRGYFEWKAYQRWATAQGLNEAQKRSCTVYLRAYDKKGRFQSIHDSITVANATPTMSGFSPTVSVEKQGKSVTVDWSSWVGITATDLDMYKIYYSTEATCTITDGNIGKVVKARNTKTTITGLSRGITYDFRVVPWDIYGEGVPSD